MTSGYYWHVHHEQLWEWCYDYDERVAYIRAEKPAGEVELRLRLMQPVRAVPERMQRAYAEWERAYAQWKRAYAECAPEMEALHALECPDCPWKNGTIFPEKK